MKASASYRETRARSRRDVLRFREVSRDITQRVDGSTRTLETETIKERDVIHKEEFNREFAIAKRSYLNRKKESWSQTIAGWKRPDEKQKKILDGRRRNVESLQLPLHQSIEESLNAEHRALAYSCAHMPKYTVHLELKKAIEFYENKYPDEKDTNDTGSLYFTTAMHRIRQCALIEEKMTKMANDIASDEQVRALKHPVHVKHVAPGVLQKVSRPMFPFTKEDEELAISQEAIESDISPSLYESYVIDCLKSNGRDPGLVVPLLSKLITTHVLRRDEHIKWPELLEVSEIQERSVFSIPYVPNLFWGQSDKEWFVCCTFRIGASVYENVWLEASVMCSSPVYGDVVSECFLKRIFETERKFIENIKFAHSLISLEPAAEEFTRLLDLQSVHDQREELADICQKKRELRDTLRKLQIKSRRL